MNLDLIRAAKILLEPVIPRSAGRAARKSEMQVRRGDLLFLFP